MQTVATRARNRQDPVGGAHKKGAPCTKAVARRWRRSARVVLTTGPCGRRGMLALVCCHHTEDMAWVPSVAGRSFVHSIVIYDTKLQPLPRSVHAHPKVQVRDKSGWARTGYPSVAYHFCMHFRADETVATHILFLHGHDTSWHQKQTIRTIVDHVRCILLVDPSIQFMKASDMIYDDWMQNEGGYGMLDFVQRYWSVGSMLFPGEVCPRRIVDINTEQSVVHVDRIAAHDSGFWERLFRLACAVAFRSWEEHALEGMFHRTMGEPWERPFVVENHARIKSGSNELELRREAAARRSESRTVATAAAREEVGER